MLCDICKKKEGKTYILFPEGDHLTEEIEIASFCRGCKSAWYKRIPQESKRRYQRWIIRSAVFKHKLTYDEADNMHRILGSFPDEEDEAI